MKVFLFNPYTGQPRHPADITSDPEGLLIVDAGELLLASPSQPKGEVRSHSGAPAVELDRYDAGLLSDYGGGNVEWWQDYIRAELDRAHDFYQSQRVPVVAWRWRWKHLGSGAPWKLADYEPDVAGAEIQPLIVGGAQ